MSCNIIVEGRQANKENGKIAKQFRVGVTPLSDLIDSKPTWGYGGNGGGCIM